MAMVACVAHTAARENLAQQNDHANDLKWPLLAERRRQPTTALRTPSSSFRPDLLPLGDKIVLAVLLLPLIHGAINVSAAPFTTPDR